MIETNKKVAFYTLGCKLNFSETSTIARKFEKKGFTKVDFNSVADIYVINTCSVTEHTDKKCRQAIKKAIKNAPNAFIVVVGCYSQLKARDIASIPGVDLILGTNEKFNLFDYIKNFDKKETPQIFSCDIEKVNQFFSSFSLGERTRSFLKIQDGCDYSCSYCTIPLARGKSRNNHIKEIVKEAERIAQNGIKEIVITGVNIGDFGKSTNETFYDLINELDKVEGIERYRISSIEPNLLSGKIIEFVAQSNKFVPHFHMPLQSGNNKILQLMNRKYKKELFKNLITRIKSIIPEACIGIDVITGFPGETNEDFMETYNFINSLDVSYLHVFSYSERKNTKAVELKEKVSPRGKNERSKTLHKLSDDKRRNFYLQNLKKNTLVLFEANKKNGEMFGFTENYIRVETKYDQTLIGKIVEVKLKKIGKNGNVII